MKHNNTKKTKYHHISTSERDEISFYLAREKSDSEIAIQLNRHRTTIWREQKRNKPKVNEVRYLAHLANNRAKERWKTSHERLRLADKRVRAHVETRIRKGYSPEQTAARIAVEKPDLITNYESIYQYIYKEARHLIPFLRKQHRKRRNRGSGKNKRAIKVQNRTMIDKRPKSVETRKDFGHWEGDTMVSRLSKAALMVVYERKTMMLRLQKMTAKTAEQMRKKVIKSLCKMPDKFVKTITLDNGTENAEHEYIARSLNADIFFCNPYHSWEKGGVENIIGLIREYLPKKTDIAKLSNRQIKQIERKLNNRPRKRLGYRTPLEVYREIVALAA
jgi:IS30 family transposase